MVAVVATGGALAGAIALAATRGNGGAPASLAAATPTVMPAAERSSPPGSLVEMRALGEEAAAAARALVADVYLFTASYKGGLSAYGFISRDGRTQVAAEGPNTAPGKPRWEAKTDNFLRIPQLPGPLDIPPPLDLKALRRHPAEIVRIRAKDGPAGIGTHRASAIGSRLVERLPPLQLWRLVRLACLPALRNTALGQALTSPLAP